MEELESDKQAQLVMIDEGGIMSMQQGSYKIRVCDKQGNISGTLLTIMPDGKVILGGSLIEALDEWMKARESKEWEPHVGETILFEFDPIGRPGTLIRGIFIGRVGESCYIAVNADEEATAYQRNQIHKN